MPSRRVHMAWGLGLAAAAALAASVSMSTVGRNAASPARAGDEPPLEFRADEVVRPVAGSLPLDLRFSGPLVAPRTATVRAKAAGTLLSLAVEEGQRVRAGQRLGRLDLEGLESRVAERRALLAQAQAQLRQAERTHASDRQLAEQRFISANALEASRSALASAQAQWQAAAAQLDASSLGVREAVLLAPISGIVAKRRVVAGEKLAPEQELLTVVDLGELELAGQLPAHRLDGLVPGQAVEVQVEGRAAPVAGRLARIAPVADAGTRAVGVVVAIDNRDERLRAGPYAVARMRLPDPVQRLLLPQSAIVGEAGQETVWLVEGGVLLRRAVTTGRRDDEGGRVEVLGGLTPQSQVLAMKFDRLREGRRVLVAAGPAEVAALR